MVDSAPGAHGENVIRSAEEESNIVIDLAITQHQPMEGKVVWDGGVNKLLAIPTNVQVI